MLIFIIIVGCNWLNLNGYFPSAIYDQVLTYYVGVAKNPVFERGSENSAASLAEYAIINEQLSQTFADCVGKNNPKFNFNEIFTSFNLNREDKIFELCRRSLHPG